jgi:hypothetical protein
MPALTVQRVFGLLCLHHRKHRRQSVGITIAP